MKYTNNQIINHYIDKEIYIVCELGYYYCVNVAFFDTYQEALDYIGKTEESYCEVPRVDNQYSYEYKIVKKNLKDLINEQIQEECEKAIDKEIDKIKEKGNRKIYLDGYTQSQQETKENLKALLYFFGKYCDDCNVLYDYDMNKQSFKNSFENKFKKED